MSCFDVTPDFGMAFKYQKSNVPIKYMEAGFNPEQRSGDFFIEFEEQIHDNELELCFDAQRAKGVIVLTFPNDGGKAASDALLHVMALQNKFGVKVSRGVFPESLKRSFDEQKAALDKLLVDREFNEKLQAAEKISLDEFKGRMEKVHDDVQVIGHVQKGIKEDVQSIGNDVQSLEVKMEAGMQSQTVKLDSQSENIKDVKQKLCDVLVDLQKQEDIKQKLFDVIADLQKQVKQYQDLADYKTRQCDVQESKTAAQTQNVNQQKKVIADKDDEIQALRERGEASRKREESLRERIKELEGTLQVFKAVDRLNEMIQAAQQDRALARTEHAELQQDRVFARTERAELKQSIAEVQENARSLGAVLAREEERAAKRQRV